MNIRVEVKDYDLVYGLKTFKKANNQAVRNTLNIAASSTRKEAIQNINKNFTLRNTFTVRSVVFDKATQQEIKDMQSTIGALKRASYLKTQEEGGLKRDRARGSQLEGKIKESPSIPMKASRGGAESKPVSTLHYVSKIKRETVGRGRMSKSVRAGTASSRSVAQMYIGHKYGLYIKRNENIFRVKSFNKIGRNNISAQLEHLYTIHYSPIRITKNEWLQPSYKKASRNLPALYQWQLKKEWREGKFK